MNQKSKGRTDLCFLLLAYQLNNSKAWEYSILLTTKYTNRWRIKMRKSRRAIISAIVVVVLIGGIVGFLNYLPIMQMTPALTGIMGNTHITVIKNNSNDVFFIDTDDGCIMIDAGSDADAVVKSMYRLSLTPDEIKYIFLTHTDYDHVAALSKMTDAQIFMSEKEKSMLDGTVKRNAFKKNSLPKEVDVDKIRLLKNNEKINLNSHTVECLDASGHTIGSMIYLVDDQYLFTGDAFKVSGNRISIHPYTMDKKTAEKTISRLDSVFSRSEVVFTAHYGYYPANELRWKANLTLP